MEKLKAIWSSVDAQVRQSPWVSIIVACFSCSAVLIFGLFFVKHSNIPEGARKLSWELMSVFFQGGLAGLIVLYFTQKYQKKKELQQLQAYVLLIKDEIETHCSLPDFLDAHTDELDSIPSIFQDTMWNRIAIYLTPLPRDVFENIFNHYRQLAGLKFVFQHPQLFGEKAPQTLQSCAQDCCNSAVGVKEKLNIYLLST